MPNRIRRNSVVDMIARVPVHRGSLLKSIENLLKTIESSENSVMIPTLLRDKVRVDAWELLFVAKILKASILGHSDLVEFYMNHIGHHHSTLQQQAHQQHQPPASPADGTAPLLSPTLTRPQQSPMASPLISHSTSGIGSHYSPSAAQADQQQPAHQSNGQSASPSASFSSAASSVSSSNTANGGTTTTTTSNQSRSTASWITASQQQQQQTLSSLSSSSFASNLSSDCSSGQQQQQQDSNSAHNQTAESNGSRATTTASSSATTPTNTLNSSPPPPLPVPSELPSALEAARPLLGRQAQPPSLLQLTTTNNHINSMAASFTNFSLEQLSQQLGALSPNGTSTMANGLDSALSITTTSQQDHSSPSVASSVNQHSSTATSARQHELRTSRSAGCLLRGANNGANSGASSPRTPIQTPTTPYPQAETLANGQANGLIGDPSAPVKLLLQIEQLKVSISHVTTLLESVVELYKNSIDNIAQ